jgi:chromosome segregation ATPase
MLSDNIERVTNEYDSYISKTDRLERMVMESEKAVNVSITQVRSKDDQIKALTKKIKTLERADSRKKDLHQNELNQLRNDLAAVEEDRQGKADELIDVLGRMDEFVQYKERFVHLNNDRQ